MAYKTKGAFVSKGHNATGTHAQTKAAISRANKKAAANCAMADKTVTTMPSAKMARGY